ncbi:hypothetical protein GBAR_LOCUS25367 [Geodia barretti]|nr:hypothetical protein GBAR_LOCUS25367 [Geodia barretti]
MERAVLALLCLSAAFCFASAQDLPRCPDDWLTFYAKYQRENYAQESQSLLVDQQCTFEVSLSFGPFVVTPTISVCRPGTVSQFIAPSPRGGVYICQTVINVPEPAPFAAPLVVNDIVPPAPSAATEPPTRRPADGGISECPTGAVFSRNRFIFSSL